MNLTKSVKLAIVLMSPITIERITEMCTLVSTDHFLRWESCASIIGMKWLAPE
jgi:hypothetical protein